MKPLTTDEIRALGITPKARRLLLADFLEGLPEERFDMETYWHHDGCGTVGCIAGWAIQLFSEHPHDAEYFELSCAILGIPPGYREGGQICHLFLDLNILTPQEAARRLREIK